MFLIAKFKMERWKIQNTNTSATTHFIKSRVEYRVAESKFYREKNEIRYLLGSRSKDVYNREQKLLRNYSVE